MFEKEKWAITTERWLRRRYIAARLTISLIRCFTFCLSNNYEHYFWMKTSAVYINIKSFREE